MSVAVLLWSAAAVDVDGMDGFGVGLLACRMGVFSSTWSYLVRLLKGTGRGYSI